MLCFKAANLGLNIPLSLLKQSGLHFVQYFFEEQHCESCHPVKWKLLFFCLSLSLSPFHHLYILKSLHGNCMHMVTDSVKNIFEPLRSKFSFLHFKNVWTHTKSRVVVGFFFFLRKSKRSVCSIICKSTKANHLKRRLQWMFWCNDGVLIFPQILLLKKNRDHFKNNSGGYHICNNNVIQTTVESEYSSMCS